MNVARRARVALVGAVVALELLALGAYVLAGDVAVTGPRYLLYPLVWVNAGLLAVALARADRGTSRPGRARLLAAAVAAGYLCVLLVLDGSLALASPGDEAGLRVVPLPPGWGPALVGTVSGLRVTLFPFEVVGYGALAYLLYDVVLDAVGAAIGGALGLAACAGCAAPGVAGMVSALLGSAAGAGAARVAVSLSYDLSTLVFLATLALLYYRPFDARLALDRPDPPDGGPESASGSESVSGPER